MTALEYIQGIIGDFAPTHLAQELEATDAELGMAEGLHVAAEIVQRLTDLLGEAEDGLSAKALREKLSTLAEFMDHPFASE
jgi:hypothetical protein